MSKRGVSFFLFRCFCCHPSAPERAPRPVPPRGHYYASLRICWASDRGSRGPGGLPVLRWDRDASWRRRQACESNAGRREGRQKLERRSLLRIVRGDLLPGCRGRVGLHHCEPDKRWWAARQVWACTADSGDSRKTKGQGQRTSLTLMDGDGISLDSAKRRTSRTSAALSVLARYMHD